MVKEYVIEVNADELPKSTGYVDANFSSISQTTTNPILNTAGGNYTSPVYEYWPNSFYTYWYPSSHYFYQIVCPRRGCRTANWCELDTPKPCTKCGSTLKAVSKRVDFEVEVG